LVGIEQQIIKPKSVLKSSESEFIAVTGRRRVGKTFLIDEFFKKEIRFSITVFKMEFMKVS
ncbi:MAG: hypothetical protein AAGK97_16670, partial [Bacteroidota bacterium]